MSVPPLAYIPSPAQGVWHLGPLPLRGYALSILAGIVLAIIWSRRRYAARGGDPELILDVAIAAIPFGIIGGRLYHVLTDHEKYFGPGRNPWQALNITAGGLGIWGAVALGTLAGWVVVRRRRVPAAPVLDAVAPTIIAAQAIGRLGNWFNQELHGAETTLPWGLEIYERVDDLGRFAPITGHSTGQVLAVVHPTFLYELIWNLLVAAALVWADRRFRLGGGRVFALYVAGYTLGRFWIELMRADPATEVLGGLRINTVTSAAVFAAALLALYLLRGRHRESAAFVRGESHDAGADRPLQPAPPPEEAMPEVGDRAGRRPGAAGGDRPGGPGEPA